MIRNKKQAKQKYKEEIQNYVSKYFSETFKNINNNDIAKLAELLAIADDQLNCRKIAQEALITHYQQKITADLYQQFITVNYSDTKIGKI